MNIDIHEFMILWIPATPWNPRTPEALAYKGWFRAICFIP